MLNQSPEVRQQIETLRAKSIANTISLDEYRLAIRLLRADRVSAQEASAKGSRSAKPTRSADELLSELDNL